MCVHSDFPELTGKPIVITKEKLKTISLTLDQVKDIRFIVDQKLFEYYTLKRWLGVIQLDIIDSLKKLERELR